MEAEEASRQLVGHVRLTRRPWFWAPAGKILHGVIDLAFRTPVGWDLVDYKTDQIAPDVQGLVARYRPQVRAYGEHWSHVVATPSRTGLYFVRTGESDWEEGT